jgi:hypothetical protein
MNVRDRFGQHLTGAICEIGPGLVPFPTAPGSRVTFLDKSVPGGRDATWPELVGQPPGVQADHDVDVDVDGLRVIDDASFDGAVAAHVIEHLANPVAALVELERVLRIGGRLALVVPERQATFDFLRPATDLGHVLDEHRAGVTTVSDEHIREFCEAIWAQPPFHPPEVREWHDPTRLDADRLDLHRRRSIHVHCWSAEDMASTIVGLVLLDLLHVRLLDVAFHDDGEVPGEFGLLLERVDPGDPTALARDLTVRWTELVLADGGRDPARVATFVAALARDLASIDRDEPALVAEPVGVLGTRLRAARADDDQLHQQLAAARAEAAALEASRALKVGRVVTGPARALRRFRP